MQAAQTGGANAEAKRREIVAESQYEAWAHWPIHWSGVWVGALAAIALVLLFGLVGIALGAHLLGPEHRVVDLKKLGLGTLAFSVFSSFLAFVIGGWVASKVAGILRSEPAMLHGAIVWLVAVPILIVLAALGAGSTLGGWYAGLTGAPSWAAPAGTPFDRPQPLATNASDPERTQYNQEQADYRQKLKQWQEDSPKVARNSALGALTALLLGLVGSVIGGWMASGEPMTLTYHRTRPVTGSSWSEHASPGRG
jgi:hypothetical protein